MIVPAGVDARSSRGCRLKAVNISDDFRFPYVVIQGLRA